MALNLTATLDQLVATTTNWTTVMTDWTTASDDMQTIATWVDDSNGQYVFACDDADPTAASDTPETFTGMGNYLLVNNKKGTILVRQKPEAAFVASMIASINWAAPNARINFAFKQTTGFAASVTDAESAFNLIANGYNFYGHYSAAASSEDWFYPGQISGLGTPQHPNGTFPGIAQYVDAIWFDNALQLALSDLMASVTNLPQTEAGFSAVKAIESGVVKQGLLNGVIVPGVVLTPSEVIAVNQKAGVAIDTTLSSQGWYLQVLPGATRNSAPICNVFYTDGGQIVQLNVTTIDVQ